MPEQSYEIPQVDQQMYQNPRTSNPLGNEEIVSHIATRPIEYNPYPILHLEGASYPMKGWYQPEIIAELNIIKAIILRAAQFPAALLLVNKEKAMMAFNGLYDKIFHYTLNEPYLLPAAKGFYKFTSQFLIHVGIDPTIAKQFCFRVAHIIQYDDAYRYRLQDILSETTHAQITSKPRQELLRLTSILTKRTPKGNLVANKLKLIITPVSYLLLVPKYRKAFIKAMTEDVLKDMQYDDADRYWACLKNDDYLFTGRTVAERTEGLQRPKLVKVNY